MSALSESVQDEMNERKLIQRELRRGGGFRGGWRRGGVSGRSRGGTKSVSKRVAVKRGTLTNAYSSYMGTLYYYNTYYSRSETCRDYTEHDYCASKLDDEIKSTVMTVGPIIVCIISCITVCCCCANWSKIKTCCT